MSLCLSLAREREKNSQCETISQRVKVYTSRAPYTHTQRIAKDFSSCFIFRTEPSEKENYARVVFVACVYLLDLIINARVPIHPISILYCY